MKQIVQSVSCTIDGIDIVPYATKFELPKEMNRLYDVLIISIAGYDAPVIGKDVSLDISGDIFTGFVYSSSKSGENTYTLICRGDGAKFTEPYSQSETDVIEPSSNSHDLCAQYSAETGIVITNTASNIYFGGGYVRNGTILSALTNIANVSGAEYYTDTNGIIIAPNKSIDSQGTVIPEDDIFDFVAIEDTMYNNGVGIVSIINGGEDSGDIVSSNSIYAEIDECSGDIHVFPNPYGEMEHTTGVSKLSAALVSRSKEISVLDENMITLDAAIESIQNVTLNGAEITGYQYMQGHNVFYFETSVRGIIQVEYTAYVLKGYANVEDTPAGRFISFDLYYLDQALRFQGFLSNSSCYTNASTDGDMTCIVPSETYYHKGFDVWTIGGSPRFEFYANAQNIYKAVSSTSANYVPKENATLEPTLSGYRHSTRYGMDTALLATSQGVNISFTTEEDAGVTYFVFDRYYPDVIVSYEVAAVKHHVEFPAVDADVAMVIFNDNTDQVCSYDIDGLNLNDLASIPCAIPADVPVDIASELRLEIADISGSTVNVVAPNNTVSNMTVNDMGTINIHAFMDGTYRIDTSVLKPRTEIKFTVNTGA